MKVSIRLARESDLKAYSDLLERTYREVYPDESIGLKEEHFSKEIFSTKRNKDYLEGNIKLSDKRKTWLSFLDSKMVGSITITDLGKEYELTGFYVLTKYHGKGVGRMLWDKALSFAKGKDIVLDVFAHNTRTIDIYKGFGFDVDVEKGEFYRHWPEWPEDVSVRSIYMRFSLEKLG